MHIPYLPVRGHKLPHFMGGRIRPRMEICETSVQPIPMVPLLHQSNGYIKRKLRAWRAQKCNGLVGALIVLTRAEPQSTAFDGGQYRAENGYMRNFGPTNPHGTTFAPKQWLHQKKATCMESSKNVMLQSVQKPYLLARDRKLLLFMGVSIGPRMEICETPGLPIRIVPRLHQSNGYIKRKLRVWRAQKCIALVDAETVLTSAGPQTTPFHGGQYRAENGNMRNFVPTNPHGIAFSPKQWLY